jgi:hypothetical protein
MKELRRDAMLALTSLANALGQDFLLFLPLVRRTMDKRGMRDPVFERLAGSDTRPLLASIRAVHVTEVH